MNRRVMIKLLGLAVLTPANLWRTVRGWREGEEFRARNKYGRILRAGERLHRGQLVAHWPGGRLVGIARDTGNLAGVAMNDADGGELVTVLIRGACLIQVRPTA